MLSTVAAVIPASFTVAGAVTEWVWQGHQRTVFPFHSGAGQLLEHLQKEAT